MNLCKILKLGSNCTFETNTTDVAAFFTHFSNAHNAKIISEAYSERALSGGRWLFQASKHLMILKSPQRFVRSDGNAESYFLVKIEFHGNDTISWMCLYLGNSTSGAGEKYEMKLSFNQEKVKCKILSSI